MKEYFFEKGHSLFCRHLLLHLVLVHLGLVFRSLHHYLRPLAAHHRFLCHRFRHRVTSTGDPGRPQRCGDIIAWHVNGERVVMGLGDGDGDLVTRDYGARGGGDGKGGAVTGLKQTTTCSSYCLPLFLSLGCNVHL